MHHGRYGAVIEKVRLSTPPVLIETDWMVECKTQVKKGSVADVMGHLLPGDEVNNNQLWSDGENNAGLPGGRVAGPLSPVSQLWGGAASKTQPEMRNTLTLTFSRCETSSRRAVKTEQSSLLFLETRPLPRVATLPGKGLARQTWLGDTLILKNYSLHCLTKLLTAWPLGCLSMVTLLDIPNR